MPELPEVETVRRALEKEVLGRRINDVRVTRRDLRVPIPSNMESDLNGAEFLRFTRRGKYIIADMNNAQSLVIHLGMSGTIGFYSSQDYIPAKHDHVILSLSDDKIIVFNDPRRFGQIITTPTQTTDTHPLFQTMGPEPFSDNFTENYLRAELKKRKGPIKTVLLDQKLVAGLGNIYVCEALYQAGLSPRRKASTIQGRRTEKLYNAIMSVLREAIEAGGSSLKDYKTITGEPGYFQHRFAVFDKAGRACPECKCLAKDAARIDNLEYKRGVRQITQAGRSTFYCPTYQK